MRIQNATLSPKASDVKRKNATAKGDFGKELSARMGIDGDSSVDESQGITYLNPLLSLQEVESDEKRAKRQTVDYGNQLLDKLESIRYALLDGKLSLSQIKELQTLLGRTKLANPDPQLESIIADIELRASVEIAKMQRG